MLAAPLLVTGCATASKTYAPDGRAAYTINCGGVGLDWGSCYQKAGSLCGTSGYDILATLGDTGMSMGVSPYGASAGTAITRSLVVACKSIV